MMRLQPLYDQWYGYAKKHAATLLVAGLLLLNGCILAYRIVTVSSYAHGFGTVRERNIIYSVQHWMRNGSLYQDPRQPPFAVTQYSPLYYLLCGAVARVAGLEPGTDVRQLLMIGRAVSLLCDVLAALLLYRFLRRVLGTDARTALVAAGLGFLLVHLMYPHTITSTDALKCLLVLASVYLMGRHLSGCRGWRLAGSAGCMVMAAFAKLDAFFYLPLLLGFLFFAEGVRSGAVAVGWTVAILAACSLLLVLPFGDAIFANVFGGVAQRISLRKAYEVLGEFTAVAGVLTAFAWFAALEFLASGSTAAQRFLALFGFYSFALALGTSVKLGSATAYYSDFQNVALLLAGGYVGKHRAALSRYPFGLLFATTFGMVLYHPMLLFFHTAASHGRYNEARKYVYYDQARVAREVRKGLSPGEYVMSYVGKGEVRVGHDYLANFLFDHLLAPNEDVYAHSPPEQFNTRALRQLVESGRLRYIVEAEGAPLLPFMGVDLSAYRPVKTLRGYTIYKWQPGGNVKF